MKHFTKRVLSITLVLLLVLSVTVGTLPTVVSAKTGTQGTNTGTRHTLCTSLSTQAQQYYTGSYTWETLSAMTGGNEDCLDTDNELFQALHNLMSSTMTASVSYSSLTSYWPKTDGTGSKSSTQLFYSDTTGSDFNREHVWPKSHASFHESNGGSDLHHLRPTDSTINSTRGNLIMGNVKDKNSSYKTKSYNGKTVLYYTGSLCEVNDNIKGDVARILLYVWCRWEEPNLFKNTPTPVKGPNDEKNDGGKVIESLDTLLQWCALDPVDTWEMSRNDQVENIQGNRNAFIDYPELAWLVFGKDVPANITTPTNNTGVSGNPSTGNGSNGNSGSDNSGTGSGSSAGNTLTMVDTPSADTAFKLRMDKEGTSYYFNGSVAFDNLPWYLGTTTTESEAKDVYAESVDGGYKLYFYNSENTKTYFCIYQDGTHISICINHSGNSQFYDKNGTTFSWNATHKTFTATVGGNEYFIGSDSESTHKTFSAEKLSEVGSGYPSHLYAMTGSNSGSNSGDNSGSNPDNNSGNNNSGCHHSWGEGQITASASCDVAGSKKFTCSICGETKVEAIQPIGKHNYGSWKQVTAPTSRKQGLNERKCVVCGHTETQVVEALGSSIPTAVVIGAGCTLSFAAGGALCFLLMRKKVIK